MEALRTSPVHSLGLPSRLDNKTQFRKLISSNVNPFLPTSSFCSDHRQRNPSRFELFTTISSSVSTDLSDPPQPEVRTETPGGKFDWYSQWYPVMPVCDLDKRVPHGKKVIGLDVVVWWDRNESDWKVFDDSCPHRLAPLSEGRIDQWGRLQCVYHGWCFNGSGDCNFIPQAPPDGPPVHTFKKACAAIYPSTVQNGIVWFWPNTDPQYKDILMKKKPPYISEIDDPSFTKLMGNRDIPYGYEVLIENLMDPAHVPYAHYGIMRTPQRKSKADREGGIPLDLSVDNFNTDGFNGRREPAGFNRFCAPCVFYSSIPLTPNQDNGASSSTGTKKDSSVQKRMVLVFICIPVSPGKSRLIWTFPRNFGVWIDKVVPRWMFHIGQNLILDSDLYLLHVEERKIMDVGPSQWQKACFVPTKSDALVVGFRKWLNKYAGGQVDWRGKFSGALPPTPPREQLMDRYWTHVVNCSSCNAAYKGLNVLEVVLQVISISLLGIVAAAKQSITSMVVKTAMVSMAVLCFAASKWLAHFVYKVFHYHDYNHAFR
ncbi:Protochlorophyllide-dependent translocon component 52 [Morus notabilis]|uniref:Protochlorophyllide-dependent translocon component 52 n=1 Tax=Morus notabilis TaxID=981085 RepID=W9SBE7_9ROSA|nr:protochlorophyllide-dependent translocon component 52, chloroplastic [Morus notabilis]EXC34489.1 Protochlorophyllide-dependent translocon component 52 [Morus notabilis]